MKKFYIIFTAIFVILFISLIYLDFRKQKQERSDEAVKKYEQTLQEVKYQLRKDSIKYNQ